MLAAAKSNYLFIHLLVIIFWFEGVIKKYGVLLYKSLYTH